MVRNLPLLLRCVIMIGALFIASDIAVPTTAAAEKPEIKATHTPKQPKSGEAVTVNVSLRRPTKAEDLVLQYQVVEPGKYIALSDVEYPKNWTQVAMEKATAEAPDSSRITLTVVLPAALQKNRRLIRYRVYSQNAAAVIAPAEDDPQPNYAYFVYDGIPEWRAAINPTGQGKEREVVTFGRDVMQSVQAYHLISKRQSIENITWGEPLSLGHPQRHEYKYTGTLVADGKTYDHVRIRARGGNWRHAMGKNMWKIDFNKGHNLEARDDYHRKYETKWGKLNLGACIQQGNYGMRGEQGLIEAAAFRLFNLAGVDAPHTHWIQLRIVDGAEETPKDQYRGDFWGLYLATEEVDDDFLKEHGLPEGNIYKMEFGSAKAEHLIDGAPTNGADVIQFMQGIMRKPDAQWWQSNVNLQSYFSYRAILECIHHYDIGMGKNYFYYHNPESKRWQVVPWDVDLSWGDQMFGTGAEPFYRAGLLRTDPFKSQYEQRLAEIRDLLFNSDQCGALLDDYAAIISNPSGGLSMAHADRAKWDYHPIMSSEYSTRGKADPGLFYRQSPTRDFKGMVQLMKDYAEERGKWVDGNLLVGATFPSSPRIATSGKLDLAAPKLKLQLAESKGITKVQWRLAEISNPNIPTSTARQPGKYEINAIWESTGGTSVEVPTRSLETGHTYRVRARVLGESDQWSRWSRPLQFTKSE